MASRSSDSHQSVPSAGSHAGSSMPAAASLSPPQHPPSAVRLPEGWNPWEDLRFLSRYVALINTMVALDVRTRCFGAKLITQADSEFLATKELQWGRVAHNEYLMGRLGSGAKSFPGFVQVLDGMGPALEEIYSSLASMLPSSPPEHLHQDSIVCFSAAAYHPREAVSCSDSDTMASGVDHQSQLPSSSQRFGRPHHEGPVLGMDWCEPTMFERGHPHSTNVQASKVLPKVAGSLRPTVRNAVYVRFPSILPADATERILAHPSFPRLEGFTPYPTTLPGGDGNDRLILLYLREPPKGRGKVDREKQVKRSFAALIRKIADHLQLAMPRKESFVKHVVSTRTDNNFCAVVSTHCLDVLSAVNLQMGRPMINVWSDIICSPSWPATLHSVEFREVCDEELRSCIATFNVCNPSTTPPHGSPILQRSASTTNSPFHQEDPTHLNVVSTSSSTTSSLQTPTDGAPFLTDIMERGLSMGSSEATAASRDSVLAEAIVFRHPLLRQIQVCPENEAWIEVVMDPLFQLCETIDIASVVQKCVENNILTDDEQLTLQHDFAGKFLQQALMSTLATEKPPELVEDFISAVRPYRNLAPEAIATMEQRLHCRKAQSDKPEVFKLFRQESADSQQSPSEVLSGDVDGFQRLFKHVHGLCETRHSGISTDTSDSLGSFNGDMLSPSPSSSGKVIFALALIGRSGCVMDFLRKSKSINLSSEQISTISTSAQGGCSMVAIALDRLLLLAVLLTSPCSDNAADCRLAHIAINSTRHAVLLLGQDDLSLSGLSGQCDGSLPWSVCQTIQGALRDFAIQQLLGFEDSPSLTLYVRSTTGQPVQKDICDSLSYYLHTAMSSVNSNIGLVVKVLAGAQTEGLQRLAQQLAANWEINWLVYLSVSAPMCILKSESSDSASNLATTETGSCLHTSDKNSGRNVICSFSLCDQPILASVAEMLQQLEQSCGCLQFLSEWTGNVFVVTVLTKSANDSGMVSNKPESFGASSATVTAGRPTTASQPTYSSLHCNTSYNPSRQSLVLRLHTEGWNVVDASTDCSACLNLVCRQLFVCAALSDVIVVAGESLEVALQNINSALKIACKILNWPIQDGSQPAALVKKAHFFNARLCLASDVPDAVPLKLFPVLTQLVPSGAAEPYPILHGNDGHARLSQCIALHLESILSCVLSPALLRNMLLLCSAVLAGDAHCLDVAEIANNHARDVQKSCAVLLQSGTLESDDIPVSNTTLTMADGQPLVVTDERLKTDEHLQLLEGEDQEGLDSLTDVMQSIVATIARTKEKTSHKMLSPEEVFHEIKHVMSQLRRRRKDRALSYLNSKYVNCLTSLKQFQASLADLNSFFAEGMELVPSESGIWEFCGERCDQCWYFCIQPKHGADVLHDCLDRSDRAHLCVTDCAACVREGVDPKLCVKAAGHKAERIDGDHFCEPENDLDVHRCKEQCVFRTENPVFRCQCICRLRVDHSGGNHRCGLSDAEHAELKRCCKPCSGPGCAKKCGLPKDQLHSPKECTCGVQGCSELCSCGNECHERIVHLHRPRPHADIEIEHHCGDEHSCLDMCSEEGACVLKYPTDGEDPAVFKAVGNYARKLRCSRKIRMGKLQHQSSRPHRCDNDPEDHFCDNVCTVCRNSCLERAGHVGPCVLKHGRVANNDELRRLQTLAHEDSAAKEWNAGVCQHLKSAETIEAAHNSCRGTCSDTFKGVCCKSSCQKALSHDGHCLCDDCITCKKPCSIMKYSRQQTYPCPNRCTQPSEDVGHVCLCVEEKCLAICVVGDCPVSCFLPCAHDGDSHTCGRTHKCNKPCANRTGVCKIVRAPGRVPGNAVRVSGTDGYRLQCSLPIPARCEHHESAHSCESVHGCGALCPLCDSCCSKDVGHEGAHCMVEHGPVVNLERLPILWGELRQPVNPSGAMTCDQLCAASGRGHIHTTPCSGKGTEADSIDMRPHSAFWSSFNFEDPCTACDGQDMEKCPALCHYISHPVDQPVYCRLNVLHQHVPGPRQDESGNISMIRDTCSGTLPGHEFPCSDEQHVCRRPCSRPDYGAPCTGLCQLPAGHHTQDQVDCVCDKEHHVCGQPCGSAFVMIALPAGSRAVL